NCSMSLPRKRSIFSFLASSDPPADKLSALSRRPRDGSVVSFLHCMNDLQPEGHMASHIERRKFLATLGGAAVAWPLAARAQQPNGIRRIGVLMGLAEDDPEIRGRLAAFRQGLEAAT